MESEHKDDVQKSQIKEIKKGEKKKMLLYIVIMCVSGVAGASIAFLAKKYEVMSLYQFLYDFTITHAKSLLIILFVILLILIIINFSWVLTTVSWSLKFLKKGEQGDEEEQYENVEKIEIKLSRVLGSTNFFMILQYFLFSFSTYLFANATSKETTSIFLLFTTIFLFGVVTTPYLQQKIITVERLLNPEKKGSVYDFKFTKQWEECCDERERLGIYKAAYKAYRSVINTCLLLWSVCILSGILTGSGFAPALIILIIWGVSICVYNYHCGKN